MLAKDVLTEEWLADVLQESLEMDWTSTDGARAIMRALKNGAVKLPQSGGQVVSPSHSFLCGTLDNYPCDCDATPTPPTLPENLQDIMARLPAAPWRVTRSLLDGFGASLEVDNGSNFGNIGHIRSYDTACALADLVREVSTPTLATVAAANDEGVAEQAAGICDSEQCLAVFGAPEWAELSDDGKQWVEAMVKETVARLHKQEGKSHG